MSTDYDALVASCAYPPSPSVTGPLMSPISSLTCLSSVEDDEEPLHQHPSEEVPAGGLLLTSSPLHRSYSPIRYTTALPPPPPRTVHHPARSPSEDLPACVGCRHFSPGALLQSQIFLARGHLCYACAGTIQPFSNLPPAILTLSPYPNAISRSFSYVHGDRHGRPSLATTSVDLHVVQLARSVLLDAKLRLHLAHQFVHSFERHSEALHAFFASLTPPEKDTFAFLSAMSSGALEALFTT